MEFIEIAVTNFRGIRGPVTVPLRPGLNVLHGPNEIGKSTVLEAAWACLTQRSTVGGATRDRMLPRGGGVPEVRVRFTHGGETFDVTKVFNKGKGSTLLRVEGTRTVELKEGAAEERLRTVMGVGAPSNRGKIEQKGLWPIVWVEQGTGGSGPTSRVDESGRAGIDGRLAEVGGEVFAGRGAEKVFEAAENERKRYYTTKEDKPRDELKKAISNEEEASETRDSLVAALAEHERSLDEHARLERGIEEIDVQLPDLRKAAREAQAAYDELETFERLSADAASDSKIALLTAAEADKVLEERRTFGERLKKGEESLKSAAEAVAAADAELGRFRDGRPALLESWKAAKKAHEDVHREVQRLECERRARELGDTVRRLAKDLETVEAQRSKKVAVKVAIEANPVTQERLIALRELAAVHTAAVARVEAVSAHVELRADNALEGEFGASTIRLAEGARHEQLVSTPTELRIAGVATLFIRPGGEDLAERRRAADEADTALKDALQEVGLPDPAAAEAAAEARRQLEAELTTIEVLLQQLDSDGLETRLAQARGELQRAREDLTALDGPDRPSPKSPQEFAHALDEHRALVGPLGDRASETLEILRAHDSGTAVAEKALSSSKLRREEAEGAFEGDRVRLQEHRTRHGDDAVVAKDAAEKTAAAEKKKESAAGFAAELESRNPEQLQRDLKRTRRSVDVAVEEREGKIKRKMLIEGRLSAQQVLGLHDRVAAAATAADRATAESTSVRRRAEAAKLLFDTLNECRSEAQGRYMKPLADELEKLVALVFPSGRVQLDETMKELRFDRGVVRGQHDFDELSGGAKEQVGVLVRLALARLMAGDSGVPVLLDDALVATDEARFAAMQRALDAAAQDLQVVFVTCHWGRLRGLGLTPDHRVDLEDVLGVG